IGETINHRIKQQAQALYTEDYQQLLKGPQGKINGQPILTGTKAPYEDLDKVLNGEDSLAWFPSVEYYLNLAASGKLSPTDKFTDWDKYSRILGVTWSGNIELPNIFFRAEMYANETGRELAKFLQMLINREIKINIITHSLGARVALTALNILGDFDGQYDRKIDNLIMLEAAVADNAITKHYTKAHNPLAMELFPFAHNAVQSIQVMYSLEDGVLGADNRVWDFDDGVSDVSRGTYPLKYGMFANRNRAMRDYYPHDNAHNSVARQKSDALQYHLQMECLANMGRADKDVAGLCGYFAERPAFDRRVIAANVKALIAAEMEKVNGDWQTELNILRPWSHFRRFPEDADYVQHIIEVLTTVIFKVDWALPAEALEIRPALGYLGKRLTVLGTDRENEPLPKKEAKKWHDHFIAELTEPDKDKEQTKDSHQIYKFYFHDQSAYFTSHSAMKDLIWEEMVLTDKQREKMKPTRFYRIYQETYKDKIMDEYLKGKFGRFK
ncbi:alpha/beta hydrolase, partial [Aggregatibacter actinomycetemcomitans]|uniref:alpha/beta hydrolase n=1 Tax=Aggregatibacter actinomycetemcomitans TaxID=714 RepID=UPI00197C7161